MSQWNNHGYDIAKSLAHKFDLISPVWFQVVSSPNGCQINGVHDLDQGWISDIRRNNSLIKIVPRFVFEKWDFSNFRILLSDENFQNRCITSVLDFMQRNRFDGAVIEGIFQIHWMLFGETTKSVLMMLWNIAEQLKSRHMLSVLVVPASLNEYNVVSQYFTPQHYRQLVPYFDYFSVMLYDFPSPKVTPVAPLYWVKASVELLINEMPNSTKKILMGLNFYGYDYDLSRGDFVAVVGAR
ncbi:unnamed protein product [Soboliphyme baturini]|uniref:Chitinase domain-containing protein 1 n=1 Tax=Soboliphyme baturini TaxID=241478 RepID=A0A183IY72_9BILA|nr:unnamed protein product [Soboliphyme baturini]